MLIGIVVLFLVGFVSAGCTGEYRWEAVDIPDTEPPEEPCTDPGPGTGDPLCELASDGFTETIWIGSGEIETPKYLSGDLEDESGDLKCVSGFRGMLVGDDRRRYYPQKQSLFISMDGTNWNKLIMDDGSGYFQITTYNSYQDVSFPEVPAKYFRVKVRDCDHWEYEKNMWGFWEWEFYENPDYCSFSEFQVRVRDFVSPCIPDCVGRECGPDGCEGVCPPGCTNPHGTTSCSVDGLCQPVCDSGWGNCDGDNTNGCETDLKTNENCGDCGIVCTGGDTCVDGICVTPSMLFWTNTKFQTITEAELGDTVFMIYDNVNSGYNFEVYEDDAVNDDEIRVGEDAIQGILLGDTLLAGWTIGQSDYDKGDEGDGSVEFYFKVDGQDSGILDVVDSPDNYPPNVEIVKPVDGDVFKVGQSVEFEAIFEDEDDDLKLTWSFGDANSETISNCLTTNNCNTSYSYSNSGTKAVIVKAEEMTRSQYDSDRVVIKIFKEGINIFPKISSPVDGNVFSSPSVDFDASDSYVARCLYSCPSGKTCYSVGDLECYDLDNANIPTDYNFWFNWTFSEGYEKYGNWNDDYSDVVSFSKSFFQPSEHFAILKVGYVEPPFDTNEIEWSDGIFVTFTVTSEEPLCLAEDESSKWVYWDSTANGGAGDIVVEEVTDSAQNCYKADGNPYTTCCPNDKGRCVRTVGDADFGKCEGEMHPLHCSEYLTEEDCNSFHSETAINSVEANAGDGFCGSTQSRYDSGLGETCWWTISDCKCVWDLEESVCEASYTKSDETCESGPGPDGGTCTYVSVDKIGGDCESGDDYETYEWDVVWDGSGDPPNECVSSTKEFSCEDEVQLPFFDFRNFFIALILICLIYVFKIKDFKHREIPHF